MKYIIFFTQYTFEELNKTNKFHNPDLPVVSGNELSDCMYNTSKHFWRIDDIGWGLRVSLGKLTKAKYGIRDSISQLQMCINNLSLVSVP